jgi:ABC-type transport system involved in multi-copper enzyme maturation permease subunit
MSTGWWVIGAGGIAAVAVLAALFHRFRPPLLGPLFGYELLRLARRGTHLRLRVGMTLLLLIGLLVTYLRTFPDTDLSALLLRGTESDDQNRLQTFGETFLIAFLIVQQTAVMLLTPVYAGGAIAEEKERGGMDFLLTTPLTRWELVAGKLAARLTFVLAVLAAGLPVLMLTLLFGGVSPDRLLAGFAVSAVTVVAVGTFAVMLSVYRHTLRDVLLWCYGTIAVLGVFGLCFGSCTGDAGGALSPVSVMWSLIVIWTGKQQAVDATWGVVLAFATVHLSASVLFFILALSGVRTRLRDEPTGVTVEPDPEPSPLLADVPPLPDWYRAQMQVRGAFEGDEPPPQYVRGRSFVVPRLQPGGDPFVWKERHFAGRLPLVESQWVTMALGCGVTAFLFVLCTGLFVGATSELASQRWIDGPVNLATRVFLIAAVLAVPVVGVRTAVSVGEERAKQTLVSLLTLPVPRRNILQAKGWAAVLRTSWVFVGTGIALLLGLLTGGLHPVAVAGTTAMFAGYTLFAAALGLWLSVRCDTALRAVLVFLGFMLATALGPVLVGPIMDATAARGVGWTETFDLFSPPVAVWHATDWTLNGQRVFERDADNGSQYFVFLVAGVYGAAGRVLWAFAVHRFEAEGRE